MKKIAVLVAVAFISVCSCFADVFPNGEKILDTFWTKGQVIKIVQDKNNIQYINKSFIQTILIDEDDMKIQCYTQEDVVFLVGSVKNDCNLTFSIDKCDIYSDENGNIVIENRPKKKK